MKKHKIDARLFFDEHSLIIGAFRYYCGRMTIASASFADELARAWNSLRTDTQKVIKRDLEQLFAEDDAARRVESPFKPLGMDMDRKAWEKVGEKWQRSNGPTTQGVNMPTDSKTETAKPGGKKVIGKGRGPWHSGGNMVLSEITKEIQSEWADAYNPSGFRHGVSEAPIYLYRELANGLVSVLARALKAEYRLEHVYCSEDIHWDGNTDKAHAKWHNTDADWIAEAERILRKNR